MVVPRFRGEFTKATIDGLIDLIVWLFPNHHLRHFMLKVAIIVPAIVFLVFVLAVAFNII